MFGSGKPQFNTAKGYADYVKEQERQRHIQDVKESQLQQYNADMQRIAQEALGLAKEGNKIANDNKSLAEKSIQIASDSRRLSKFAILVALVAIVVSIILNFC